MKTFTRAGLHFDVRDSGPPDGPVVMLLHGFPQTSQSWERVTPALVAAGYRVLAPDQRGYSPGARPSGRRAYRTPELVSDIAALVDASGAEKVHLVGHDWGSAVAWAFAGALPDRLHSLSALSVPHPAAFLRSIPTSRQGLASWYMYAFQIPRLPERYLVGADGQSWQRLAAFLRKTGASRQDADRDARWMGESGALTTAINYYRAMPLTDLRSTGSTITVPTLFVWSDGDTAVLRVGAERCGDWVTGPYRYEVLRGVSHWIPDEAPTALSALLLEHFAAQN